MSKKVYLFCVAGMSTSMLAKNMQDAANAHNLPITVEAFTASQIDLIVNQDHPDCILLGPQVSYIEEEISEKYGDAYPVSVIDSADYGSMDGERVLKASILAMKRFKAR